MYYIYIIYSEKVQQFYCGQTNNVIARLKRHNNGETSSIRKGIPWKIIGYLTTTSRSEAIRLEKIIKQRGIKRWLQSNLNKLEQTIPG